METGKYVRENLSLSIHVYFHRRLRLLAEEITIVSQVILRKGLCWSALCKGSESLQEKDKRKIVERCQCNTF